MPRYFFDVYDDTSTLDDTGTELADIDAARAEAMGVLSDLARQPPAKGCLMEYEVVVRANDGTQLLKAILTFRCIVLGERQTQGSNSHADLTHAGVNFSPKRPAADRGARLAKAAD